MARSKATSENKKDRAKARRLADYFNLKLTEWECIYTFQGRVCAICKNPIKHPATDHRHSDGLVRGILCMRCNRALGRFNDSIKLLRAAADYIENPPATSALGKEHFGMPGRVNTKKMRKLIKQKKALTKPQTCGKMVT